jgi:4-hydroxybenzoate polyprenyltransferase
VTAATYSSKLAVLAGDIKISHSIFALPFALLATFLAAGGFPGWDRLALIVICMVFARTFAMLANRYVDRRIDARNPRTAGRALPSGRLRPGDVLAAMGLCAVGLIAGAAMFGVLYGNWWPAALSPAVLAWLGAYGLMKRWTLLCHFFLGAALAISPLAAGLAIEPAALREPMLWWLAGFVMLWVGGFDIIYALQDVDVDRRDGLHSIPAKLGRGGALLVAKAVHLMALALLIQTYHAAPLLGGAFRAGIVIVAILLVIEHIAATRGQFHMAFFTLNGVISFLLGGLGIADVLG